MASAARFIALFFAMTFLTALVEPWLVQWLTGIGYYDDPVGSIVHVREWIERLIGAEAFPWAGGAFFGLAVGLWIDWFLRRFLSKSTSKEDRLRGLCSSAHYHLSILRNVASSYYDGNVKQIPSDIGSSLYSFYITVNKEGIRTPDVPPILTNDDLLANLVYLTELAPLFCDGHVRQAKRKALDICNRINQAKGAKPQSPPGTATGTQP